jgi:hypothetical protein
MAGFCAKICETSQGAVLRLVGLVGEFCRELEEKNWIHRPRAGRTANHGA